MKAGGREPRLVANPAEDVVFAAYAEALLEHGAASIAELEDRLRVVYPLAAVHARELDGERIVVWYVYRDGHWVGSRPKGMSQERANQMPDPREDLRSTEESILADADHVKALEEEKIALDPADPRVDELSAQVERLAGGIEDKAKAERSLSEEITGPNS